MKCPRCERAALDEQERDGLVVDVCGSCRGIWLDRGELEKLIARASRELDEMAPRRDDTPPRGMRQEDGHDQERHHREGRQPNRKRRWFEALGDIFE